jgi:hypothetical protein
MTTPPPPTFTAMPVHPERHRDRRPGDSPAHLLVIHTSEQNTNGTVTAENLGRAWGTPAVRSTNGSILSQSSYHWAVDTDTIVAGVDPDHGIAYHAPPNSLGEAICLTGRAGRDWTSPDVDAQLDLAARLAAWRLAVRGWPVEVRTVDEVRRGLPGLCGHVTISAAFGKTDHTDPGPQFPWSKFLTLIRRHMATPTQPQEDPMLARRVRIRGTANVFLIGAGPALHLTPELNAAYETAGVPLVVVAWHDQFMTGLCVQSGIEPDDFVNIPEGV